MEPEELTEAEKRKFMNLYLIKGDKKRQTKEDRLADEYRRFLLEEPFAMDKRKEKFLELQALF